MLPRLLPFGFFSSQTLVLGSAPLLLTDLEVSTPSEGDDEQWLWKWIWDGIHETNEDDSNDEVDDDSNDEVIDVLPGEEPTNVSVYFGCGCFWHV